MGKLLKNFKNITLDYFLYVYITNLHSIFSFNDRLFDLLEYDMRGEITLYIEIKENNCTRIASISNNYIKKFTKIQKFLN
jgi:hypothetical protein